MGGTDTGCETGGAKDVSGIGGANDCSGGSLESESCSTEETSPFSDSDSSSVIAEMLMVSSAVSSSKPRESISSYARVLESVAEFASHARPRSA